MICCPWELLLVEYAEHTLVHKAVVFRKRTKDSELGHQRDLVPEALTYSKYPDGLRRWQRFYTQRRVVCDQ